MVEGETGSGKRDEGDKGRRGMLSEVRRLEPCGERLSAGG